ncbi:MAG TPA: 3-deoxy-7-phosphoheptulonate synthase, partial [Bacteroidales bacterium]|nr:3-deoxy-7-phosphoheptulonate synthase [Bacteroidales bacterium]
PYSFRGIGLEGLKEISSICKEKGMKIISEVMEASQIEPMLPFVDIFQV